MTEEQARTTEQTTVTPPETPPEKTEGLKSGEGTKPVEFENPETEARFKRVYFNMKQYERAVDQTTADNRKLLERIEKMESEQAEKSSSEQTAKLREAEKAAMEEGDYEKAQTARDRITDLKVDSKIPKPEVKEEEPWLTPEREDYMAEWASQRDEKGVLLRPWADPEHENHQKMVQLAEDLVKENPNISLVGLLDHWEIAARRAAPKRTAAAVLPGSGDVRPNTKKMTLSEDEKLIVRRMYPGTPAKDAEQRYIKSKEKYL